MSHELGFVVSFILDHLNSHFVSQCDLNAWLVSGLGKRICTIQTKNLDVFCFGVLKT